MINLFIITRIELTRLNLIQIKTNNNLIELLLTFLEMNENEMIT